MELEVRKFAAQQVGRSSVQDVCLALRNKTATSAAGGKKKHSNFTQYSIFLSQRKPKVTTCILLQLV